MAALYWMFIGSAILCNVYAAYVISCAIALKVAIFELLWLRKEVRLD